MAKGVRITSAGAVSSPNAQFAKIMGKYRQIVNELEEAVPPVIVEALQPTFKKALKYTPKLTGALRASGYLEVANVAAGPRAEMGFGYGGVPNYTLFVHERVQHYHAAPTRAKFLQVALSEDLPSFRPRLIKGFQRVFGRLR
jgi:hypothetical protein